MFAFQIVSVCVVAIALIAAYAITVIKNIKIPKYVYIITSAVLGVVFFFRFMWGEDALRSVFKLTNSPIDSKTWTVVSVILNMFLQPTTVLLIMYPFFKCDRLSNFIKYWGLFVSVLCIIFIKPVTMGIVGKDAYAGFKFRTLLMALEIAILFGYSVVVFMENNKFKLSKKDGLSFI